MRNSIQERGIEADVRLAPTAWAETTPKTSEATSRQWKAHSAKGDLGCWLLSSVETRAVELTDLWFGN
jgi:hypothetical protein